MVSPLRERHERKKLSVSTKITVNLPVKDLGQVGPRSSFKWLCDQPLVADAIWSW